MLQRDYILRMIEQAGEAIRRLRDRILGREADATEVRDELGRVLDGYGFDLDFVRAASGDTLFLMVAPTGEVDATRCWVLAESLYLDGLAAHQEERREVARASFEKALGLYRAVAPGAAFYGLDEANARVEEVMKLMEPSSGESRSEPRGPETPGSEPRGSEPHGSGPHGSGPGDDPNATERETA